MRHERVIGVKIAGLSLLFVVSRGKNVSSTCQTRKKCLRKDKQLLQSAMGGHKLEGEKTNNVYIYIFIKMMRYHLERPAVQPVVWDKME